MKTRHKIGLGLGAGALTLGGVAGFAQVAQADPTPTPSASASTPGSDAPGPDRPGPGKGDHGAHPGGPLAAGLAQKLGIDQTRIEEALRTARKAAEPDPNASTTPPTHQQRQDALASGLASALGIDQAQVSQALTALENEQNAARAEALQTRLDQAVTAGTLTQAEADAVKKAVTAGVIEGGHHR